MRTRYKSGCLFQLHGIWYIRFGKSDSVRLGQFPTKTAARREAERFVVKANAGLPLVDVTINKVITKYVNEEMPKRASTRATYYGFIKNHIQPKFGDVPLLEFGRPPELVRSWLLKLDMSTKSRREIKNIMLQLMRCAELWGWINEAPNLSAIRLPKEKGETVVKARVLPLAEYKLLAEQLAEPFKTMAAICYFHGLRVSELFGLKWRDINWLEKQMELRQAVVAQIEDEVKTPKSEANHPLADQEIQLLKTWRSASEFTEDGNYIFASPFQAGELPYSYRGFQQILERACDKAGIQRITTHSFRHSLRARLKANGASAEITTEIMRHTKYDQSRQYGQASPISPVVRDVYEKMVKEAM